MWFLWQKLTEKNEFFRQVATLSQVMEEWQLSSYENILRSKTDYLMRRVIYSRDLRNKSSGSNKTKNYPAYYKATKPKI
jgi:hypothetical protein